MGQRHQLFVIAKVHKRYRTLAALHNQWLYGVRPLERCLRLLAVLQAEPNRVPILQELRAAREKSDRFWTESHGYYGLFQPFPFIATCLTVGSSFEPDLGYSARVHLLRFNTTLEEIDNNDGITVVDISHLGRLRYCFAFPSMDRPGEPMRASTYLWRYCKRKQPQGAENHGLEDSDEDSDERQSVDPYTLFEYSQLASRLEAYELIDGPTLNNTWPRSDGEDGATLQEVPGEETPRFDHNSLSNKAMDKMLTATVKEPDFDFSLLAEAEQLLSFMPRVRSTLAAFAENGKLPSSATTARYVEFAFVGEETVDLSAFGNLASMHLVEATSKILDRGNVKSLDLSHLRQLSETDLKKVLGRESGSRIETLYLLEMPQISLEFVSSSFRRPGSRLKDIYHTELLRRPFAETHKYSTLTKTIQCPSFTATSSQGSIKQILWARVVDMPGQRILRKADGVTIDWLRSKPPIHGTGGMEDDMYPAIFPLHDIRLTPTEIVTGLVNYFTCASKNGSGILYDLAGVGSTIAKSFATARSKLDEPSKRIGHLPEALFSASEIAARVISVFWPIAFPELKAGEWSIVVVNEHYPFSHAKEEKFRLAFITPKTTDLEKGYRVKSLEEILEEWPNKTLYGEEVTALADYWRSKAGFVSTCKEEEINELLQTMRRNMESMEKSPSYSRTINAGWEWD